MRALRFRVYAESCEYLIRAEDPILLFFRLRCFAWSGPHFGRASCCFQEFRGLVPQGSKYLIIRIPPPNPNLHNYYDKAEYLIIGSFAPLGVGGLGMLQIRLTLRTK